MCFCSGLPLRYKIKHLSDQPTSIKVSPQQLAQVIQRLTQCGNPASLINLETGEIDTYWPVASTYTYVHEEEIAPLPVMAVPTYNLPVAEDLGEFTAQYAEGELVPF